MFNNGNVALTTIDNFQISFLVNEHPLRLYHRGTFENSFLNIVSILFSYLEVVGRRDL